jgi:O-6-methylguanine DNA methyltransferase
MKVSVAVECVESPIGTMLVVADDEGVLRALDFADCEARMQRLLARHYGTDVQLRPGRVPAAVTDALTAYFAGDLDTLAALRVRTNGSAFQRAVWAALRAIPSGTTATYGGLAASLDKPNASRAVGLANGANPVGIVVPCHRVIGANGTLTGYAGGLSRKRWLLDHEARWSAVRGERRAFA